MARRTTNQENVEHQVPTSGDLVPDYVAERRPRVKQLQVLAGSLVALTAALAALAAPWGRAGTPASTGGTGPELPPSPVTAAPVPVPEPEHWYVPRVPEAIFGVVTAGSPSTSAGATLDGFSQAIAAPNTVAWFVRLTDGIRAADLEAAGARGAVPMVTIEPWPDELSQHGDQAVAGTKVLTDLVAGVYDGRIATAGRTIAAFEGPVLIRWAHEANGDWYPWAAVNELHGTDLWIEAYRHLVDVMRASGADNARFVWGVNHIKGPKTPVAEMFPGEDYVDYVGVSGFWTGDWVADWSKPTAFEDMFGPTFSAVRAVTAKPIFLAETGVAAGLNRSYFIDDLVAHSIAGDLAGWVWMEENKIRGDWRLVPEPAASTRMRELIERWRTAGLLTGSDTVRAPFTGAVS